MASVHDYVFSSLLFNPNRIIKDPRFERLPCMHKGTYADDCIVNRVEQVCIILHICKSWKFPSNFSTNAT